MTFDILNFPCQYIFSGPYSLFSVSYFIFNSAFSIAHSLRSISASSFPILHFPTSNRDFSFCSLDIVFLFLAPTSSHTLSISRFLNFDRPSIIDIITDAIFFNDFPFTPCHSLPRSFLYALCTPILAPDPHIPFSEHRSSFSFARSPGSSVTRFYSSSVLSFHMITWLNRLILKIRLNKFFDALTKEYSGITFICVITLAPM